MKMSEERTGQLVVGLLFLSGGAWVLAMLVAAVSLKVRFTSKRVLYYHVGPGYKSNK